MTISTALSGFERFIHVAKKGEHWVYAIAAISALGPVGIWYTSSTKKADSALFQDALETTLLPRAKELFGTMNFTLAMVCTPQPPPQPVVMASVTINFDVTTVGHGCGLLSSRCVKDNDSVHNSDDIRRYLRSAGVKRLEPWPAHSPDLNIIENVWGFMTSRMAGLPCSGAVDLRTLVVRTWDSITDRDIEHLYASIPKRYKAVIDCNGAPTRY